MRAFEQLPAIKSITNLGVQTFGAEKSAAYGSTTSRHNNEHTAGSHEATRRCWSRRDSRAFADSRAVLAAGARWRRRRGGRGGAPGSAAPPARRGGNTRGGAKAKSPGYVRLPTLQCLDRCCRMTGGDGQSGTAKMDDIALLAAHAAAAAATPAMQVYLAASSTADEAFAAQELSELLGNATGSTVAVGSSKASSA